MFHSNHRILSPYHSHIAVLQFAFFFPRIAEIFPTLFMFDIFTYS